MEANVPPRRRLTFKGLHGVASGKIETLKMALALILMKFKPHFHFKASKIGSDDNNKNCYGEQPK
jgi:hypothetical protein